MSGASAERRKRSPSTVQAAGKVKLPTSAFDSNTASFAATSMSWRAAMLGQRHSLVAGSDPDVPVSSEK